MTAGTLTLAGFLLARIAEDEATARSAEGPYWWNTDWQSVAAEIHGERHDPARVLAECEAKRQIVEQVERDVRNVNPGWTARILELLALPYATHPGYRGEWRP